MKAVKELRTRLGMTQQAFASLLGISFVSVNKWEKGRATPTGLSALLLAFLESALTLQHPLIVVQALRGAGGDPLAVVRTLTELERSNAQL